ncbi:MAG: [FeFe] hydrogenase H-cluster maturation GTPase HydF [Lachnospiraceae bacterium]|nr:[FeFe] hydrogenase H-cluster maturation GTPase HydF [Lachnospiraceae bacterium]
MSTLNETPGANRLHIGVFGRTNSGKSSFINAFTGQQVSIVADVAGTTTDPVAKPMEIQPLGACVIIDTAGFDDSSALGKSRVEKTKQAAEKSDIGVILFSDEDMTKELEWYQLFQEKNTPVLSVISKSDSRSKEDIQALSAAIQEKTGVLPLVVSSATGEGMDMVREQLARRIPESFDARTITGGLVGESDTVLLVMPQDIQAPKGRLILPQVQTIRELLDKKCLVMSVTTDKMTEGLAALAKPPKLIITDSQVFGYVYEQKPKESMLTSFSVLFAAYKGDLPYYIEGARAIDSLNENSRVLIAECCTHAPLAEDIGRVKLPRMLRKRFGEGLQVDMKSGTDFPQDLSGYDLIIQCGACMFNRKYVLSRIDRAKAQHIPMTNYGVTIAHLTGILDKITFV